MPARPRRCPRSRWSRWSRWRTRLRTGWARALRSSAPTTARRPTRTAWRCWKRSDLTRLRSAPTRSFRAFPADAPSDPPPGTNESIQVVSHRPRETGIVDVRVELADFDARPDLVLEARDQRIVRLRIVEHVAPGGDRRHPSPRNIQSHRASCSVELAGNRASELRAFFWSGPHQGHRRIVSIQGSSFESRGDGLERTAVDHVQGCQ